MDARTHEDAAATGKSVTAWDLPTRLFHWAIAVLVLTAWVSYRYSESFSDYLLKVHRWNGLAILTLLVWRLLWGLAGTSTSRFSNFIASPGAALSYGRDLLTGRSRRFLGHNPLGAWMVIALLATLFAQASLGLFTVEHNDLTAGPLYRLVSEAATKQASHWHHIVFEWVLLPLVALHILANLLYGLIKKEPLILAMITGKKPAEPYEDEREARQERGSLARAAAFLVVAAVFVLGGIRLVAGRLI
ncbi:MAG TPA: cytochrome b/b6 domain-containing protein [Hyphomicrobiaceae bacterium]|nr:cytochrome b/b6 domain-containing protein [Hyphomicrobiaceae bacterium]